MQAFQDILRSQNLINDKWLSEGTGETLTVVDKFSQEVLAELPMATSEQMEEAMAASVKGFHELKSWSAGKRAEYLGKLKNSLEARKEAFAQLIAAEAGKPIGYARAEISRCIVTLETAEREAMLFTGETVPIDYGAGTGKTAFTKRFPIGPIACISPFNFPLNLALHKIAPALACGCSLVLKPAPQAPLSALAFAALVQEVGYPAGVVNVLMCDIPVAQQLVTDPRMKMLSFTGSPQVGWHLKNIAGEKKTVLELGGNAAVIIDKDADLPAAAKTVANGAFLYAGQICISTQRIFVDAPSYDEFSELLKGEIEKIHTGDPRDEKVTVGPIIDAGHLDRIAGWVDEARSAGAEVLSGGEVLSRENNLYAPTLLTNTSKGMKVMDEEVFGPVAVIEKVDSFEEAIDRTNDSKFGLQAGVFTNSLENMKAAHEKLDVGGIIINNVPGFRVDSMPYGGVKASGLGREGIKYAMEEMTEPRLIVY